jgi:hypothetical protein
MCQHNSLAGSPSCSDDEALGRQILDSTDKLFWPSFSPLPKSQTRIFCKTRDLRERTVELFAWLRDGPDLIKFRNQLPGIRFAPMIPPKGGYWRSIAALIDSNVRSRPTWNFMASVPECASVGHYHIYLPIVASRLPLPLGI